MEFAYVTQEMAVKWVYVWLVTPITWTDITNSHALVFSFKGVCFTDVVPAFPIENKCLTVAWV